MLQQTHTRTFWVGCFPTSSQAGRGQHPQCPQYRVGRIFCSSSGLGVMVQTLIPCLCCWIHTDRRPECHPPQETHCRRFAICTVSSISGFQLPAGYHTALCSLLCRQWIYIDQVQNLKRDLDKISRKIPAKVVFTPRVYAVQWLQTQIQVLTVDRAFSGYSTCWQSQRNSFKFGVRSRYIPSWINITEDTSKSTPSHPPRGQTPKPNFSQVRSWWMPWGCVFFK